MSESSKSLVEQFKMIVCDDTLSDAESLKYLKWGKMSIEAALNYYYQNIQKNKTKRTSTESELFDKLKKGAVRDKQTQQIIENLKQEYQLPVVSKFAQRKSQLQNKSFNQFQDIDYIPNILNDPNYTQRTQKYMEEQERQIEEKQGEKIQQKTQRKIQQKKQKNVKMIQQQNRMLLTETDNIYLGEYIIYAFSISKNDLTGINSGTEIEIRPVYIEKKVSKGFKKSKKTQQKMILRVYWADKQIGRIQDQDTRILYNLIISEYIKIKTSSLDKLRLVTHFTGFKLKCEIFLKKKAISIPIVESFENKNSQNKILQQFGEIRQQFIGLFSKLNLKLRQQALIKLKSKFIKTEPKNKITSPISIEIQQKKFIQNQQRNQHELKQLKNNPLYKRVQTTLDQIKSRPKNQQQPIISKDNIKNSSRKVQITRNVQIQEQGYEQLVNLNEENLIPTEPGKGFVSTLHHYQSLALTWMLRRQGLYDNNQEQNLHPMWMEYQLQNKCSFFFNQFTGQISVKPPFFASKCLGGILADEMGLGKTVMLISLMLTNRPQKQGKNKANNLIVLPLTLLDQWESQIQVHTKNKSLKVLKYYEKSDRSANLPQYDVVLTTYGVISHQFAQGFHISKQGLFKFQWFRVILDQAHYIKGRIIQAAKAVFNLRSHINWCLTGTPIQNKLDDIFSLIHFIRYTPWSDYTWWNTYINKPHEQKDPVVFPILRTILKKVLLRRTKQSKLQNGKPIIELPPKHSYIDYLRLGDKQQKFYDTVYESSKKEFDELEKHGAIEAKYMKVLEILMRLRQICCHPILFRSVTKFSSNQSFANDLAKFINKRTEERENLQVHSHYEVIMDEEQQQVRTGIKQLSKLNQSFFDQVVEQVEKGDLQLCNICLSNLEYPIITVCMHIFCKTCIVQAIESVGICPTCRTLIKKQDFIPLPRENRLGMDFTNNFIRSTKMIALMQHIKSMKKQQKAVVFSQFLGMIDLIQEDFKRERILYLRMDGSSSQKERSHSIDLFKNDTKYQVFIISLKSGGVGLNLTVANKVFMMDPWWNPAVQEQAIERVHRIGQKREVTVYRFIIQNSIESRMMQLHESKRNISNMAISQKECKESNLQRFKYLMEKY